MEPVLHALERAMPPISVRTIEPLGEGDFCVAYLVNGHLVVRKAKHLEGGQALKREECLLARIAGDLSVTAPVPRVVSPAEPSANVLAVHELVPGRGLTARLWKRLPESDRESTARELGAFLARLHSLNVSVVQACGLRVADHRMEVRDLKEQLEQGAGGEALNPVRETLAAALNRYRAGDLGWTGETAILHGDVSPGHVLFDEESRKLTGVIDWGDAMVGDPPRDFIFLYEDWGPEFLALALDGYGSRKDRRFLAQIYVHYLADQLDWTLRRTVDGTVEDVRKGVIGLSRGLEDLETVRYPTSHAVDRRV